MTHLSNHKMPTVHTDFWTLCGCGGRKKWESSAEANGADRQTVWTGIFHLDWCVCVCVCIQWIFNNSFATVVVPWCVCVCAFLFSYFSVWWCTPSNWICIICHFIACPHKADTLDDNIETQRRTDRQIWFVFLFNLPFRFHLTKAIGQQQQRKLITLFLSPYRQHFQNNADWILIIDLGW